jgi:TRAP-type C4-dicarboxylate transport system substrate-binding protein
MKIRIGVIILALFLILSLFAGCTSKSSGVKSIEKSSGFKPVKITWSYLSVSNDAHIKAMQMFKQELERISGGEMVVEVCHFSMDGLSGIIRGTYDMQLP